MNRMTIRIFGWIGMIFFCKGLFAQTATEAARQAKPLASILIPLQLDSAFSDGKYKFGTQVPPQLINALEFYNGVKMAAEDLNADGLQVKLVVTDIRGNGFDINRWEKTLQGQHSLVICAPQSGAELKGIAEKLRPSETPLISLLPNDAGITGYPNFMIINPTLQTHCNQLYKMIQRNHSIDNLVLLTPEGVAEVRLKGYLKDAAKNTRSIKLKWKEAQLKDSIDATELAVLLDSMQQNVIVVPTLQTSVAQKLVRALSQLSGTYRCAVVGMPTWETIAFNKPEFKGVDVYYGTPFLTTSGNPELYEQFSKKFKAMTNALPGDMASRGYEITLRYVRLLVAYGPNFMEHINDAQFRLFNDFYFQPVDINDNKLPDYQENERIYFIRKTDGLIKNVITP